MKTVINIINNKNKNTNWLPDRSTFLITKNEKIFNTDIMNQNTIKILLLCAKPICTFFNNSNDNKPIR